MARARGWIAAGLLCLALWPAEGAPRDGAWHGAMADAALAYLEGRYAEAREHLEAAFEEARAFGFQDPRLAMTLDALARLYRAEGSYGAAQILSERALGIMEAALGPDHPLVAKSAGVLATVYQARGRYGEAEPLYVRALAVFEKTMGPEHPHVAMILAHYASLLRQTGRIDEAEELEARLEAIRGRRAGEEPAGP